MTWSLAAFTVPLMTKKRSPGDSVVVVMLAGVVSTGDALPVVVFDVLFFGDVFDDAADAEPATNTDSIAPSENVSVSAMTVAARRRGVGLLTTYLRCRCPAPPGSRSLAGAGRAGLRAHCGL